MPDKKDIVDAMLREAAGYDARRKADEDELAAGVDNEDRKKYLEGDIEFCKQAAKNAVGELKFFGWKPESPAKRAETRPAPEPEKRGPGRPRKAK